MCCTADLCGEGMKRGNNQGQSQFKPVCLFDLVRLFMAGKLVWTREATVAAW